MAHSHSRVVALGHCIPVATWLFAACGPGAGVSPDRDARFVETARISLAEMAGDPITDIESVLERPGGGYILADRQAARVRLFDAGGSIAAVLGGPGEGPGELRDPTAAVELSDGRVIVVQRADPRLTVFRPDAPPTFRALPGQYGFLALPAGDGILAGVATRDTRFALLNGDGEATASFAPLDPAIGRTPFWIWFARDNAAVMGDVIAVNTSFFPAVRLFDLQGDSIGAFGEPPGNWLPPTSPSVADLDAPGNRQRIEGWSRSFTVVRRIAAIGDSLLVVEYGRHAPSAADPYRVVPTTADLYRLDGTKIASGIRLPGPVLGGGRRLLVLVTEPPGPWTIAALEWRAPDDDRDTRVRR